MKLAKPPHHCGPANIPTGPQAYRQTNPHHVLGRFKAIPTHENERDFHAFCALTYGSTVYNTMLGKRSNTAPGGIVGKTKDVAAFFFFRELEPLSPIIFLEVIPFPSLVIHVPYNYLLHGTLLSLT